jgi:hypothetical protein
VSDGARPIANGFSRDYFTFQWAASIKVVEYLRGETRVRQTTEVRGDVAALLRKLGVPAPPPLHAIEAAIAA